VSSTGVPTRESMHSVRSASDVGRAAHFREARVCSRWCPSTWSSDWKYAGWLSGRSQGAVVVDPRARYVVRSAQPAARASRRAARPAVCGNQAPGSDVGMRGAEAAAPDSPHGVAGNTHASGTERNEGRREYRPRVLMSRG
jgi:hypothetical protein